WGEICFYRRRHGKVDWSGVPLFPCTDEIKLATVRFRVSGRSFKSTLTCIQGHVFDFATSPGPKDVAFGHWQGEPTSTLLDDPLRAPTGRKALEHLPQRWAALLQDRGRASQTSWQLHDGSTAYRVAFDDAEYLILAEREGDEFILWRTEPPADGLFYLPHHDGVPEPLRAEPEALIWPDHPRDA
ncbi:MAG TPA: hypothetical protein VF310_05060, partial [Vicinamibacteria bacterium]